MATVSDLIVDYFPGNGDVGVPLLSEITILFTMALDETFLNDTIFVTGPDTDKYVGIDLQLLEDPSNVSEGDDFLESPGYTGIVNGTTTFENIDPIDPDLIIETTPYRTKLIFTPNRALAALTEYTIHIPELQDTGGTIYEGYTTFSFTTGSGSIQVLPSSGSTSVLGKTGSNDTSELTVIKTTPDNHKVQVNPNTKQITIEFSSTLDPDTVTEDKFIITAAPATDHPNAAVAYSEEELYKSISVVDNKVIISI